MRCRRKNKGSPEEEFSRGVTALMAENLCNAPFLALLEASRGVELPSVRSTMDGQRGVRWV
jgi:hypothetical protein